MIDTAEQITASPASVTTKDLSVDGSDAHTMSDCGRYIDDSMASPSIPFDVSTLPRESLVTMEPSVTGSFVDMTGHLLVHNHHSALTGLGSTYVYSAAGSLTSVSNLWSTIQSRDQRSSDECYETRLGKDIWLYLTSKSAVKVDPVGRAVMDWYHSRMPGGAGSVLFGVTVGSGVPEQPVGKRSGQSAIEGAEERLRQLKLKMRVDMVEPKVGDIFVTIESGFLVSTEGPLKGLLVDCAFGFVEQYVGDQCYVRKKIVGNETRCPPEILERMEDLGIGEQTCDNFSKFLKIEGPRLVELGLGKMKDKKPEDITAGLWVNAMFPEKYKDHQNWMAEVEGGVDRVISIYWMVRLGLEAKKGGQYKFTTEMYGRE